MASVQGNNIEAILSLITKVYYHQQEHHVDFFGRYEVPSCHESVQIPWGPPVTSGTVFCWLTLFLICSHLQLCMLTPHGYRGLQGSPLQKKRKKKDHVSICVDSVDKEFCYVYRFFFGRGFGDKELNGFKVMVMSVCAFFMK